MNWKSIFVFCFLFLLTQPSFAGTGPLIEIRPVLNDANSHSVDMTDEGRVLHIEKTPLLSMRDFTHAHTSVTEGQIVLNLDLTQEAAERLKAYSLKNVGKKMAFIVNDRILKAPTIKDPIIGNGFLVGPLEREQADRLATAVNTQKR